MLQANTNMATSACPSSHIKLLLPGRFWWVFVSLNYFFYIFRSFKIRQTKRHFK